MYHFPVQSEIRYRILGIAQPTHASYCTEYCTEVSIHTYPSLQCNNTYSVMLPERIRGLSIRRFELAMNM